MRFWKRRRLARDLDGEMRAHREMLEEQFAAGGMPPDEAAGQRSGSSAAR